MTDKHGEAPPWQRRVVSALVTSAFIALFVRTLLVTNARGDLPFLGANDRSRWCTVRALVDEGTYEIDNVIADKSWDSIDKVSHVGRDGRQHFYSSKPPLYPTLLAGEYWVIKQLTGWTLADNPFRVGRLMLLLTNGSLLALFFWIAWLSVRRWGTTLWGQTYVMACATWGTFLTTFGMVINNHLPAAAAAMVAVYAALRIWYDGARARGLFAVAGLAAAATAANELPALAFLVALGWGLSWKTPAQTLLWFLPPVLLVAAAFFFTNHLAHDSWRLPYAHRAEGEDWRGDNWYVYDRSYWLPENRRGVDRGEPSKLIYGTHVIAGHHGVFSLTPIWLLSAGGTWLLATRRGWYAAALLIAGLTIVCFVFFIGFRPLGDRNYGGMTCGFRWMFWLIPLWLVALVPAADAMSLRRGWRALAVLLLVISALSAMYGWPYPWTHPWPYQVWLTFFAGS